MVVVYKSLFGRGGARLQLIAIESKRWGDLNRNLVIPQSWTLGPSQDALPNDRDARGRAPPRAINLGQHECACLVMLFPPSDACYRGYI
jgi:hypothetical protein